MCHSLQHKAELMQLCVTPRTDTLLHSEAASVSLRLQICIKYSHCYCFTVERMALFTESFHYENTRLMAHWYDEKCTTHSTGCPKTTKLNFIRYINNCLQLCLIHSFPSVKDASAPLYIYGQFSLASQVYSRQYLKHKFECSPWINFSHILYSIFFFLLCYFGF